MPIRDTPWPAGSPCWVDYGAADVEAAEDFYSAVLGWDYVVGEPEFGGYVQATSRGLQAAGLAPQQDPGDPPRWTTYFATGDADATAARISDAGGAVVTGPFGVGPMGRMAIALDPQGNPFGLWQSGMHIGCRIHGEPGALAWNEAMVDDAPAAREFYAAVFGFRYEPVQGDGDFDYTTFSTGDRPLGGLGAAAPDLPRGWLTCFAVASADAAVATAEASGGRTVMGPMDTPYGRFAVVRDPWDAPFEVMQLPAR